MTSFTTTHDATIDQSRAALPARSFLFVVLHRDRPTLGGSRHDLSSVDVVDIGRGEARAARRLVDGAVRKLEIKLPSTTVSKAHARLSKSDGEWLLEDRGSRNGCYVNGERIARATVRDGDFIDVGSVILRYRAALPAPHPTPGSTSDADYDAAEPPQAPGFQTLLPQISVDLDMLARIASMPVSTLLLGETGSGKEVLAMGMHALSGRPGPFVAVNCGGLAASLLESQLFGHVKGAFTGAARDEPGYVRSADGGTLLLDEIGDLPQTAQAALLRVLQEHEVVPVGGTRPVKVDIRVIAATHKPLEHMVMRGEFRSDLLARLSGYRHTLAPLRDRIEDLGLLLRDILQRSDMPGASDIKLSAHAARQLLTHSWPLNIRELAQALTAAIALSQSASINVEHMPESSFHKPPSPPSPKSSPAKADDSDPEELRVNLVALLHEKQGNVSEVARAMGKARMQIHRWMRRFDINPDDYRS